MKIRNVHSVLVQNATVNATEKVSRYAATDIAVTSVTSVSTSQSAAHPSAKGGANISDDNSAVVVEEDCRCFGINRFRQTVKTNKSATHHHRICSSLSAPSAGFSGGPGPVSSSSFSILLAPFFYTTLIVVFCLFLVLVYHCTELPSFKVLALDLTITTAAASDKVGSGSGGAGSAGSDSSNLLRSTMASSYAHRNTQAKSTNHSTAIPTTSGASIVSSVSKLFVPLPSDKQATVRQYRSIRMVPSSASSAQPLPPTAEAQIQFPTFTILAILPEEYAPPIIRALRDAQAKWEVSGVQSTSPLKQMMLNQGSKRRPAGSTTTSSRYRNRNRDFSSSSTTTTTTATASHQVPTSQYNSIKSIQASDLPLMIFSEPANNDTERLLNSMCQWINVHSPMLILSLLDQPRNYYVSTVAESAGIPFVSFTQNYRKEIDELIVGAASAYSDNGAPNSINNNDLHYSDLDNNQNNDPTQRQQQQHGQQPLQPQFKNFQNNQNLPPPLPPPPSPNIKLSLDLPIHTLADATFELLRAQYWFDAILIVDDSIVSDLFARRLNSLCRNWRQPSSHHHHQQQRRHDKPWRRDNDQQKQQQSGSSRNNFGKFASKIFQDQDDQTTMPWMNLQKSGIRKSPFRVEALNSELNQFELEVDGGHRVAERERFTGRGHSFSDNRKTFEFRKSREASLLDVWKNLNVIRLSRSLMHNEFYLRMAEIQTTHRRVVLVHCDWATTKRVMDTARELDLFNGDKIWILLDGLLESSETFDSESFAGRVHLPMGMLALRNRHRNVYDSAMLNSIVELLGKAALNLYHGKFYPNPNLKETTNRTTNFNAYKSKTPFNSQKSKQQPQLPPDAFINSKTSSSLPLLASSSSSFSSPSSPASNAGCNVANYTDAQLEYRFGILSELQKLVDTILARYRKSPIKRCNSLYSNDARKNGGRLKKNAEESSFQTSTSSASFFSSASAILFNGQQHQKQSQNQPIYYTSSNSKPIQSDNIVDNNNNVNNVNNEIRKKYTFYNNFDRTDSDDNELLQNDESKNNENVIENNYNDNDFSYDNEDYYDTSEEDNVKDDMLVDKNDQQMSDTLASLQTMYQSIVPQFELLNLVPRKQYNRHSRHSQEQARSDFLSGSGLLMSNGLTNDQSSIPYQRIHSEWHTVGNVSQNVANVNTIVYIGSEQVPNYVLYDGKNVRPDFQGAPGARPLMYKTNSGKHRFRVATNIAPPFVIESTKLDNNTCLTGDFCLKIQTNVRDDLIEIFTDFRSQRRRLEGKTYQVKCCAGIAIDLLNAVARDLHFDYDLYLVADGLFGVRRNKTWDGVTADLVNDLAHMSFTAFSTTSTRVQSIDYSIPFFYSGVSCLSMSSNYTDVPLLAFLIPFSYELWAAIFASLLATAIAAAIYEWFSPFGLNPWGRQRTKNFSLASALWVMCSLLFSHLVAFKAPKSWPNKVLINVWGAFSVIFLATYTANIAAHFAGLFLVPEVNDFHDRSLMKQQTGTARSSASEGYLMEKYTEQWKHIRQFEVDSFDKGLENLRSGKLDVLIGDTAILDYFRATDPGCNLRLLGDSIFDDAYAVGMQKGFPFRESISNLILEYNEYGFLDQLHRKWYGRVHCFQSSSPTKPKPLTIRAVAGVFLMLGFGIVIGILILFAEHFVFKYVLPSLRKKPKDCVWKSPNLMFFSQKLYRFINTVELVSPHHSAKEIVANLREGQIASLFQKSVKRKAKEEARRRKSKSQFFEMIQEVRKVVQRQQHERSLQEDDDDVDGDIDEEAALNTDANVKATKPPISLIKENSILDSTDTIMSNPRIPAIRFKEPSAINDDQLARRESSSKKRSTSTTSSTTSQPLISRLKHQPSSNERPTSRSGYTSVCGSSGDDDNCYVNNSKQSRTSSHHHHPRRHHHGNAKSRRKTLQKSHLSSVSFSLENIFFEGLLSEGVSDPSRARATNGRRRRILSFDDLPEIKKELSESSNEANDYYENQQRSITPTSSTQDVNASSYHHHYHSHPHNQRHHSMAVSYIESLLDSPVKSPISNGQSMNRILTKSNTTPASFTSTAATAANATLSSSFSSSRYFDRISGGRNVGGSSLSKNDILVLWRSSERELLNRLQDSLEQKRALEEKVALLQRMLMKPP